MLFNIKHNVCTAGFIIIYLTYPMTVYSSSCYYNQGYSNKVENIYLPTIYVQRDAPVGAIVYQKVINFYNVGEEVFSCNDVRRVWFYSSKDNNKPVAGQPDGVYDIGVSGYAVAVYPGRDNTIEPFKTPATQKISTNGAGPVQVLTDLANMNLVIYKISKNVSSGPIKIGAYAETSTDRAGGGYIYPSTLNITGGEISTLSCSLTGNDISVPLGDIPSSEFNGIGKTTEEIAFNVYLDCDANTKINVKFAGDNDSSAGNPSVLALSSSGQDNVASGVGIQILYNGVPVNINKTTAVKTSLGGGDTLPFTARYIQTKSTVSPGKANGNVILNITYQ